MTAGGGPEGPHDLPPPVAPTPPLPPGRPTRRTAARFPVLVLLAVLLVAAGLADRGARPIRPAAAPLVRPMPAAAPSSALSSSWFCAGATGQPANVAEGQLVIANGTPRPVHGTVAFVTDQGRPAPVDVDVAPFSRSIVHESARPAAFIGAVVNLDGGGAVVEQVVSGSQGVSTAACATTGSDHWYFADGTTQENANLLLSLLNPYPEDAIVDLSFATEQGMEAPAEFQGIVVPAQGLVGIDVGTHLRRRARVAMTVSVRAGRVVAWKTQVIAKAPSSQQTGTPSPTPRPPGLALVLGAPSPGTAWWWPDGLAADGVTERYQIYNPGSTEAAVSLGLILDQGSADPFQLQIAPHEVATVVTNDEARVPKGVAHAATLQSTNGVGVVAERTAEATAPSPRSGLLDVLGARDVSRRWLLPTGTAGPTFDAWVIVFNPGPVPTTLSIAALTDGSLAVVNGLSGITVPPGRRLAVRINDQAPQLDGALLVEAGGTVVVERDLYPLKGPGLAAAIGVPFEG